MQYEDDPEDHRLARQPVRPADLPVELEQAGQGADIYRLHRPCDRRVEPENWVRVNEKGQSCCRNCADRRDHEQREAEYGLGFGSLLAHRSSLTYGVPRAAGAPRRCRAQPVETATRTTTVIR